MGWTRVVRETLPISVVVALYWWWILGRKIDPLFMYLFIGTAAILLVAVIASKGSSGYRAVLFNASVVFLAIGSAEAYYAGWLTIEARVAAASLQQEGEFFERMNGGYFVPDAIRGYAAAPGVAARARVWDRDRVLQDVVYTTNRYGLRIAPHDVAEAASGEYQSVVFFGCSVTVGEGVNDWESMPWVVEAQSGGRFRSTNFGFHGYGPHQMLRILETDLIDRVITGRPPIHAVYQGLMEHIERSAGNYPAISWGPSVPRYVLQKNGLPEYHGPFYSTIGTAAFELLNRSYVFERIAPALLGWKRRPEDIDLYVGIVRRAKELFEQRYHGDFTVLMWGAYDKDYVMVVERLRQANIRVFEVHKIIPDIYSADWKYKLPENEHPNAATHALIAKFLLEHL